MCGISKCKDDLHYFKTSMRKKIPHALKSIAILYIKILVLWQVVTWTQRDPSPYIRSLDMI